MPDESAHLLVHLNSLTEFAHELGTHVTGLADPIGRLGPLLAPGPVPGNFVEAYALLQKHRGSVADMSTVLDQARQAVEFAQEVTNTVAEAYQRVESQAAQNYAAMRRDRPLP